MTKMSLLEGRFRHVSKSHFSEPLFRFGKRPSVLLAHLFIIFVSLLAPASYAQGGIGGGDGQPQPPEPVIDWQAKQDANGRLEGLGVGLLGESIDPHTGGLSFQHTDVSLPGNSTLDVSISRRIKTGGLYHPSVDAEFGDWELIVPRIKVTTASASNYRTGNRCSMNNPLQMVQVPYPEIANDRGRIMRNRPTYSNEYSSGIILDVPGTSPQTMVKSTTPILPMFGNARYVTKSGWKIDCLSNITGGGEGYTATAPNGTIYRFDRFYEIEAPRLGFLGHTSSAFDRYASIVAATRVTDVHGNTVDYTYDSFNQLTQIEGSDGRVITLDYANGKISRVSANGRHWDYDYDVNSLQYYARFQPYTAQSVYMGGGSKFVGSYPTLTSVTQPDGNAWDLDLQAMSAEVPSALSCATESYGVSVTHPYGTEGEFIIVPYKHKVTGSTLSPRPNNVTPGYCPNPEPNTPNARGFSMTSQSQYYAPTWMWSTVTKRLSSETMPAMMWSYEYELDENPAGPNDDLLNWTKITQPDGSIHKYYHGWGTEPVIGNQLVKKEIISDTGILREESYTNIWEPSNFGWDGLTGGRLEFFAERPRHVTKVVAQQDGDTFTTESQFNISRTSPAYSFGNPTQKTVYSNVSTSPRIFEYTYEHQLTNWILNLPKTTAVNGRQLVEYFYNTDGQKTSQSRYTQPNYFTFSYNADGTPYRVTDALGRISQAKYWTRGTPQEIKKAVGTVDEVTIEQTVDDNGWVTSQTDAKNNTTSYSHDAMGRMIQLNPSGGFWVNTDIDYSFPPDGGAVQTITKGQAKTTITYDSMFRPVLERSQATDTAWSSYVNTKYDAMGRKVFTSFSSISATEADGISQAFDALGRPTETRVNGALTSTTSYSAGHQTTVLDALGQATIYTDNGFGERINILQPEGVNTEIVRDVWGNPVRVTQSGASGGYPVAETQHYVYDDQNRLCDHYTPESGSTRYSYTAANEVEIVSKGHDRATSCQVPNGALRSIESYDALGRSIRTHYPNWATPDVYRYYDGNGQITRLVRGAFSDEHAWFDQGDVVEQAYSYNEIGLLESERTRVDGRTFLQTHDYNENGFLESTDRTYRNHAWGAGELYQTFVNYAPDGLGRVGDVTANGVSIASDATYHPNGALHMLDYGNASTYLMELDPRQRPERATTNSAYGALLDYAYTYDANSRILTADDIATPSQNRSFTYDAIGRVATAQGPWNIATSPAAPQASASFTYDALGNLRTRTLGARAFTYNYNAKNQLSSHTDTGGETRNLRYDTRGNIDRIGYQYLLHNAAGRPRFISGSRPDTTNGVFRYDGHGRRIKAVSQLAGESGPTTHYNVYDAVGALVWVVKDDSPMASERHVSDYVQMNGRNVARIKTVGSPATYTQQVTWLHTDHLGTASIGADSSGLAVWRDTYSPFGMSLTDNPENDDVAGFTGHIRDAATGLNYMQARYYDPVIGRFLSIDPVDFIGSGGDPRYFNRYAYTANDPVNLIDPTGETIEVLYHEVALGNDHASIRFTPDDQDAYASNPDFQNTDENGNRYSVLSAGPEGGDLVSDVNRESDLGPQEGGAEITLPDGVSEDEAFATLSQLDSNYGDNLDYDLFPANEGERKWWRADDGHNSNSYVSGVLGAAGINAPNLPGANTPGYNKPVPAVNFTLVQKP
jgi:RHS repeat-associated protein